MPLVSPPHSQACWWGRGLVSEQLKALRKGQYSLNLSAAASCRNHSTEEKGATSLLCLPAWPLPKLIAPIWLAIKENNNSLPAHLDH